MPDKPYKDGISIFLSINDAYARHAAVTMASVLCNNKEELLNFYIINKDVAEENRKKLHSLSAIKDFYLEFLDVDGNDFKKYLPANCTDHVEMLFRYHIPDLVPDLDRALYMDVDIVVTGALRPLWETDLGDNYVGAVVDHQNYARHKSRLGMSTGSYYFNSGVLLINAAKWRAEDVLQDILDSTQKLNDRLAFIDQDILNVVFQKKVKFVSLKWNFTSSKQTLEGYWDTRFDYDDYKDAVQDPRIVHFVRCRNRPWNIHGSANPKWVLYFKYLRMTPYREFEQEFLFDRVVEMGKALQAKEEAKIISRISHAFNIFSQRIKRYYRNYQHPPLD